MIFEAIVPLIIILVFGLPHGAADAVLAYRMTSNQPKIFLQFLLLYIFIGVLVVIIWSIFPLFSLMFFLAISAIHFGITDTIKSQNMPLRYLRALIHGSTIILIIPAVHADEVKSIFDLLVGGDTSIIFKVIDIALYGWFAGLLVLTIARKLGGTYVFFEIALILILTIFLPPMWSFAIYFCAIHSARHFRQLWQVLGKQYHLMKATCYTALTSLISLLLILLAAWSISAHNPTDAMIRATFIGLAAFTVPHVIFIDIFGALKRLSQRKQIVKTIKGATG